MVNIKSAKKRIKINKRNRIQNNSYKSIIKTYIKKYFVTLQQYINNPNNENFISLTNSLTLVFSKLDKAKKKKYFTYK
uniref:30S ribosomal protein S20 n=1 Tax=Choristocarpus tenellus TaxID=116065 RepID=UPI002E75C5A2|nr:30S ribosomal protein S20 [Choristocarpus tenellus]WAM62350.1 30S ribosomal protein S20 [Choristocarpus tenellus]